MAQKYLWFLADGKCIQFLVGTNYTTCMVLRSCARFQGVGTPGSGWDIRIVWYDMKRYDQAEKKKSKNIRISLFLGLVSLYWLPFSYHDGSREEVLDALKHTPYKTQQISDTIPYRRWPFGHHHTALQVRDEIKQAFLSQGLSGRAIWDKGWQKTKADMQMSEIQPRRLAVS